MPDIKIMFLVAKSGRTSRRKYDEWNGSSGRTADPDHCAALDQYFYGRMDHRLNLGLKPLYIRKQLCTVQEIREALADLLSGRYDAQAEDVVRKIRNENGIEQAAEAIENYVSAGIV